jgi:hypothetical protein
MSCRLDVSGLRCPKTAAVSTKLAPPAGVDLDLRSLRELLGVSRMPEGGSEVAGLIAKRRERDLRLAK